MRVQAAIMEKKDSPEGPYQVGIEDLELEGPRADEVLIRVTSCGVCGTDRHVLHDEMPMNPYPTPSVLGHEGAGIVEAVGEDCTLVEPGDRVVMGFPFCGQCVHCRSGRPIYCLEGEQLRYKGYRLDGSTPFQHLDGSPISGRFFQQSSWSTHTIALERQLAKVPEGVDHDLMGPLGCSISTGAGTVLEELQPRPGTSIAVFGAGAVGLGAIMAAQLTGAVTIIAVDTEPNRLELARELGATHTLVSSDDTIDAVRDLTGGGADYSVEATNRNLYGRSRRRAGRARRLRRSRGLQADGQDGPVSPGHRGVRQAHRRRPRGRWPRTAEPGVSDESPCTRPLPHR